MGFSLYTEDKSLVFQSPFGEAEPKPAGGAPKIDRIARPRRKDLTEVNGHEAKQTIISFWIDRYASLARGEGIKVESMITTLEKMYYNSRELIVLGDPPGCIPDDYHLSPGTRWWIEVLTYDDGAIRNSTGKRVRTSGLLTLTEIVDDNRIEALRKKKLQAKKKKYTVKKGDTLAKIASKYKVKGGWKALAKLNNIRDPRKLKVGQVIRLP